MAKLDMRLKKYAILKTLLVKNSDIINKKKLKLKQFILNNQQSCFIYNII